MLTAKQISTLRKYVKIEQHAVDRYVERISKNDTECEIRRKLKNAYLRGSKIELAKKFHRISQFLKYDENASYYKYGNVVVVVRESGEKTDKTDKTVLTCYPYKGSRFDLDINLD